MYIALLAMLAGILAGRLLRNFIPSRPLSKVIFAFVLFLLFLLGAQIGASDELFASLPVLGWQALILMLTCVAGSILVVRVIIKILSRRGLTLTGIK